MSAVTPQEEIEGRRHLMNKRGEQAIRDEYSGPAAVGTTVLKASHMLLDKIENEQPGYDPDLQRTHTNSAKEMANKLMHARTEPANVWERVQRRASKLSSVLGRAKSQRALLMEATLKKQEAVQKQKTVRRLVSQARNGL